MSPLETMFFAFKIGAFKGRFFFYRGPATLPGVTRLAVRVLRPQRSLAPKGARSRAVWFSCLGMLPVIALGLVAQIHGQAAKSNDPQPVKQHSSQPAQQEVVVENASRIAPPTQAYRFPVGTTFYYKAEWRLFSAGIATLKMEQDPSGQHRIKATADAIGFVARLFHVHDTFQSMFDPKTFCSAELSKHTEEGLRRRDSKLQFDYGRRKGVFEEFNPKSGEKKHVENDIPECSTDVLSGVFYAASLPLEPGKSYTFPVNDGGKTVDLETRVEAREQIKTEAGTFNTLRVQPQPNAVLLKNKGHVWIWYSDDADRIPVQIRGRMGWGTITIHLTRIERPPTQATQTATQ